MKENGRIRIGTRKSDLAVVQTKLVAAALEKEWPELETELVLRQTMGDKILGKPLLEFGGKGVFVSEFEQGLAEGEIDLAVHSAKDMPMELAEGLEIIAVPEREDPRDVLVTLASEELSGKKEIIIGTSSPRRQVQIEELGTVLWPGASVSCRMLRGNVNTRLKKLEEGGYDGILLAAAGLKRLGFLDGSLPQFRFLFLDCETFIPAGGQGILAVEGRSGDSRAARLCRPVEDPDARLCLTVERQVLRLLNAGCHEPIGVFSRVTGPDTMELFGICGRNGILRKTHLTGRKEEAEQLARQAAAGLEG